MAGGAEIIEIPLYRSRAQRGVAASMVVIVGSIVLAAAVWWPVIAVRWTDVALPLRVGFGGLGVLLALSLRHHARQSWRVVRSAPGRLVLTPDALTVHEPSLFASPWVIPRTDVDSLVVPPPGRLWTGGLGGTDRSLPLLSSMMEKPTCSVRFSNWVVMAPMRRGAESGAAGWFANSPIRPPRDGFAVTGVWLRTARFDDVTRLRQWIESGPHLIGSSGPRSDCS